MQKYFGLAQDVSGNRIPSAAITVNLAGTSTLATIYSDNAFSALANPFTSASDGTYEFYAQNGRYDVVPVKAGFTFDASNSNDVLLVDPSSAITPPQIIADQNNYSPTNGLNTSVWRLTGDAQRTITGIAAGFSGQIISLTNIGSFPLLLAHESASSSAANRITIPAAVDFTLTKDNVVRLIYDTALTRWRLLSLRGSGVFDMTTASTTINNTTTATTYYTRSIEGGTLVPFNAFRITAHGTVTNNSGGDVIYNWLASYGGSALYSHTGITMATGNTGRPWTLSVLCYGNNVNTNIFAAGSLVLYDGTTGHARAVNGSATANPYSVQTLILQGDMDTANASATLLITRVVIEYFIK